MALYDVEILSAPTSPKGVKLVCTLSGISERVIKYRLQILPLTVKEAVPLSEAVAAERQLKRLGIRTRLVKVAEDDSVASEEPVVEQEADEHKEEDVIEIPEEDVKVLRSYGPVKRMPTIERKKITAGRNWTAWLIIPLLLLGIVALSFYFITSARQDRTQNEIILYIEQWRTTLVYQDRMLDKGFPPERIFYKLDELEGKIERLLTMVKPFGKATELRSRYNQAKVECQPYILDLAFRKSLEDNGYPIHPTCMVDRGMVRGSSELPESSLLRIQLLGQNNVESVYYAARVSEGTFKLIIDPSLVRNVYDARATVASLSQQPKQIQRWAERKFSLSDFARQYQAVSRSYESASGRPTAGSPDSPEAKLSRDFPGTSSRAEISLADPGSDPKRIRQLDNTLTRWTETILSSQENEISTDFHLLEEIYRRLLELEVRVDQLIGLLESPVERNIWVEKRESVYGSFIAQRQEIEKLYGRYSKRDDPFHLESAVRGSLREKGFPLAEVLVIDSPQKAAAFVVEIEINEGTREDVLATLARTVSEEMTGINLNIDRISLRYKGKTMWWTPEQIFKAAEALPQLNGRKRCASQLELSATTISLQ